MKLLRSTALATLALGLLSGPSLAQEMMAVPCGAVTVSLTEMDAAKVKAVTGDESFEKDICDALGAMDPGALSGPNEVKVTLSDGTEFQAMIAPTE